MRPTVACLSPGVEKTRPLPTIRATDVTKKKAFFYSVGSSFNLLRKGLAGYDQAGLSYRACFKKLIISVLAVRILEWQGHTALN